MKISNYSLNYSSLLAAGQMDILGFLSLCRELGLEGASLHLQNLPRTDSEYLKKGMTEWVAGWVRRGWKNAQRQPVANRDLWEQLLELSGRHQVEWHWVRGHTGHVENERCDALARAAIADRAIQRACHRLAHRFRQATQDFIDALADDNPRRFLGLARHNAGQR